MAEASGLMLESFVKAFIDFPKPLVGKLTRPRLFDYTKGHILLENPPRKRNFKREKRNRTQM
jgi:hypothetical protein